MVKIIINHTNHPSQNWSKKQIEAAAIYGKIIDYAFPAVPAMDDERAVDEMAAAALQQIQAFHAQTVICQGEFTYTYRLVKLLKQAGIVVISACSDRVVREHCDKEGICHKAAEFEFVRFRRY